MFLSNKILILTVASLCLSGCGSTIEKLKRVGKDPEMANVVVPSLEEDEQEKERYQMKIASQKVNSRKTNSLWQPGATKFFNDSRAWKVGDIIRVVVGIQDSASLNNATQNKRSGSDSFGMPSLFGKEKAIAKFISKTADNTKLVNTNGAHSHNGSGTISRNESINTEIAAVVVKVLPNGNLVIQGSQEVRVNSELREIKVAGIIRPKDISSENAVSTNQIAEARISYGGRGIVSDIQQPKIGAQIVDVIAPF
jgi:flagellar L-ring protein precursor FlgH